MSPMRDEHYDRDMPYEADESGTVVTDRRAAAEDGDEERVDAMSTEDTGEARADDEDGAVRVVDGEVVEGEVVDEDGVARLDAEDAADADEEARLDAERVDAERADPEADQDGAEEARLDNDAADAEEARLDAEQVDAERADPVDGAEEARLDNDAADAEEARLDAEDAAVLDGTGAADAREADADEPVADALRGDTVEGGDEWAADREDVAAEQRADAENTKAAVLTEDPELARDAEAAGDAELARDDAYANDAVGADDDALDGTVVGVAVVDGTVIEGRGDQTAADLAATDTCAEPDPDTAAEEGLLAGAVVAGMRPGEAAPVGTPVAAAPASADGWQQIQIGFIDDPRASAEAARALVNDAIEARIEALRAQQRALDGWQSAGEPDTEVLRAAVRGYRDLHTELTA